MKPTLTFQVNRLLFPIIGTVLFVGLIFLSTGFRVPKIDGIRLVSPVGKLALVAEPAVRDSCMGLPRPGFLHLIVDIDRYRFSQCGIARIWRNDDYSMYFCDSVVMSRIKSSPVPTALKRSEMHLLYGYPQAAILLILAAGIFWVIPNYSKLKTYFRRAR